MTPGSTPAAARCRCAAPACARRASCRRSSPACSPSRSSPCRSVGGWAHGHAVLPLPDAGSVMAASPVHCRLPYWQRTQPVVSPTRSALLTHASLPQCATAEGRFGLGFCGPMLSLLGFFWWLVYGATATSAALGAAASDGGALTTARTAVVALAWALMVLFMTSFLLSAAAASAAARARAKLDAALSGAEQPGAIPAHGAGRIDPALAIKMKRCGGHACLCVRARSQCMLDATHGRAGDWAGPGQGARTPFPQRPLPAAGPPPLARFNQPQASPPTSPSKSSIRSFASSAYGGLLRSVAAGQLPRRCVVVGGGCRRPLRSQTRCPRATLTQLGPPCRTTVQTRSARARAPRSGRSPTASATSPSPRTACARCCWWAASRCRCRPPPRPRSRPRTRPWRAARWRAAPWPARYRAPAGPAAAAPLWDLSATSCCRPTRGAASRRDARPTSRSRSSSERDVWRSRRIPPFVPSALCPVLRPILTFSACCPAVPLLAVHTQAPLAPPRPAAVLPAQGSHRWHCTACSPCSRSPGLPCTSSGSAHSDVNQMHNSVAKKLCAGRAACQGSRCAALCGCSSKQRYVS